MKIFCRRCSKKIREVPDDQATDKDLDALEGRDPNAPSVPKGELCAECRERVAAGADD